MTTRTENEEWEWAPTVVEDGIPAITFRTDKMRDEAVFDLRAMTALKNLDSVESRDMAFVHIEDYTHDRWRGIVCGDLAESLLAALDGHITCGDARCDEGGRRG